MSQMCFAEDDEVIETLASHALHEAFREGILIGTRTPIGVTAIPSRYQNGVKLLDELAIPIAQQVLWLHGFLVEDHSHVAGLLHHPGTIRVSRHAHEMDASAAGMNEEQDEHLHEARRSPYLFGEEVAGPQSRRVPLDEVIPRALAASRPGSKPLSLRILITVERLIFRTPSF